MKGSVVTFALASVSKRLTVQFSPEGHDIVCALLIRWLNQVADAHASAKEMEREADNPLLRGQASYWQHAGSFIKGKLYGHLNHRFNCSEELKTLARISACGQIPEGWTPFDATYNVPSIDYGTESATEGGGGSDSDGTDIPVGEVVRPGGQGHSSEGDGQDPGGHPAGGRKQNRAGAVRPRKKGAKSDRRRIRSGKQTGDEAGPGDGQTPKPERNRQTPRNREGGG